MIYVGIDCGREGAITWMDGDRRGIEIRDTPLTDDGDYDVRQAWRIVRVACYDGRRDAAVVIEDTISVPHVARGQGFLPASDKVLHESLGVWRGVCAAFPIRVELVHPKTWKAAMLKGVANNARAEEAVLLQRFSGLLDPKALRGHRGGARPGRVDSTWLAEYGRTCVRA